MIKWFRQAANGAPTKNQLLRFAVVGCANTTIDYAVFNALFYLVGWPLLLANLVAVVLAATASFVLNRNWTFAYARYASGLAGQVVRHLIIASAGLAWSSVAIWLATLVLPAYLAKVVAITVTFAWNFTLSRRWVWSI